MINVFLVGVGGFFGAVSRFGFSHLIRQYVSHPFPVATLMVNIVGCALIGLLYEFFKNHHHLPTITLLFIVGFLGSFTTFSAFSFETIELFRKNEVHLATLNIIGSVILCLISVVIGGWIGHYFKI